MGRIKGRKYKDSIGREIRYCDICDKTIEKGFYCSNECIELARKYGRKKAREMKREESKRNKNAE